MNTLFFDVLATGEEAVAVEDLTESHAFDAFDAIDTFDDVFDDDVVDSRLQSFTSSHRKRAGITSASGPFEGLKRIKKTGAEHLAEAIKQMSASNEQQAAQLLKDKNAERNVGTPTKNVLIIFFVNFVDLDMDDRIQMMDVFENEIKSRTFLMMKDPIMRRR